MIIDHLCGTGMKCLWGWWWWWQWWTEEGKYRAIEIWISALCINIDGDILFVPTLIDREGIK